MTFIVSKIYDTQNTETQIYDFGGRLLLHNYHNLINTEVANFFLNFLPVHTV